MGSFVPKKGSAAPAAAKPSAPAAKPSAPAKQEETQETTQETQPNERAAKAAATKAAFKALPKGAQLATKIREIAGKKLAKISRLLTRIADKDPESKDLAEGFASLLTDMEAAAAALSEKPAGWGAKVRAPRVAIEVAIGSFVAVKPAQREAFADLVNPSDLARVKVVGITPKMLAILTSKNEKVFVPRTSVENVAE